MRAHAGDVVSKEVFDKLGSYTDIRVRPAHPVRPSSPPQWAKHPPSHPQSGHPAEGVKAAGDCCGKLGSRVCVDCGKRFPSGSHARNHVTTKQTVDVSPSQNAPRGAPLNRMHAKRFGVGKHDGMTTHRIAWLDRITGELEELPKEWAQ